MKVGVLKLDPEGTTLSQELRNGWDIVVTETRKGSVFGAGICHEVIFKIAGEKLKLPKALLENDWAVWGIDTYLVIGNPEYRILQIIQQYYPDAVFYDGVTHQQLCLRTKE